MTALWHNSFKVKHRLLGSVYRLVPQSDDPERYYLTANDGMVPSGQMIHLTDAEIDAMFERLS